MYILITDNDVESVWATTDEEFALNEARDRINQRVNDFFRHKLPLRASEFDHEVRLVHVGDTEEACEVKLPIQAWLDAYYQERSEEDAKREARQADPEWAEYQRLRSKFR